MLSGPLRFSEDLADTPIALTHLCRTPSADGFPRQGQRRRFSILCCTKVHKTVLSAMHNICICEDTQKIKTPISDLRSVSHQLRPAYLELVRNVIEPKLFKGWQNRTDTINVHDTGGFLRSWMLSDAVLRDFFNLTDAGLTNVVKIAEFLVKKQRRNDKFQFSPVKIDPTHS